jgi:transcriptional pleiotropic regulator of transition state genes
MKSTGIVRLLDGLGRVVIPMELRRTLEIWEKDGLEIFVDGNSIILKKYQPGCEFCNIIDENLTHFKGINICPNCKSEITQGIHVFTRKNIEE